MPDTYIFSRIVDSYWLLRPCDFHRGYLRPMFSQGILLWAPSMPSSPNEINEILISWNRKINSVVVRALTSAVGNPGSRPCSNECSIIYAKWKAPAEQIEEAYPRVTAHLGAEKSLGTEKAVKLEPLA